MAPKPHQFQKGNPGGPGRPKGSSSGKVRAVASIDTLLEKEKNIRKLNEALQKEFDKNPIHFLKTLVIPLLPRALDLGGSITALIQYNLTGPNGNDKDGKSGS